MDSAISNTPIGVSTVYSQSQTGTNGTLILENVDMSPGVPVAVSDAGSKTTILDGNTQIASWAQGRQYGSAAGSGQTVQGTITANAVPSPLLASDGRVFTRSKPQYETVDVGTFKSVKANGAVGDG